MRNVRKIPGISAILMIIPVLTMVSCKNEIPSDLSKESIIPAPLSITPTGDYFNITSQTGIYVIGESAELKQVAGYLAEKLKPATGFGIEVRQAVNTSETGHIYLKLSENTTNPSDESYELIITRKSVQLSASSAAGVFRGIQTIRQLLPAKIELAELQEGPWKIPAGTITDRPEYAYRGVMLDVSRHFFGVNDVKRYIDLISYYKMNVMHLHLSDDQGWRIEIKSWPELAKHGGSTQVGVGTGGYYTQEQYSDIVNYARERYITIVPEIDMPGHTNAALASYAELNCDGKARDLYTGTEVGFSTLCAKKDVTYKFVDDVVRELSALTPGPYFHIGGDESNATRHDDYITFVEKVQDIVKSHGKTVIGWDEISATKLNEGVVSQFWSKASNATKAVKQGAKVLFSPATRTYLDMKYDSTTKLGQSWAAYIEVNDAYNWDPATLVPNIGKDNILGVEAPLWSETITNMDELEYMVFPRLPGIAEIGWTPAAKRDWNEYRNRLARHGERFKAMGIDFYPSKLVPWDIQPGNE
jgi:hexosaminidase